MSDNFKYDVFLSHSSKDKDVVRDIAEKLRNNGLRVWFDEWVLKPGDSIPAKIEEGLEHSRVLVLCMSKNAFGSEWAQLEAGTFRFRDPMNKERRFIPLRLDDIPIKGSLAQFLYIDWQPGKRDSEFEKLLEACVQLERSMALKEESDSKLIISNFIQLEIVAPLNEILFSSDKKHALSGGSDGVVRLWELKTGHCLRMIKAHNRSVYNLRWSINEKHAISGASESIRLWDFQSGQCMSILKNKGMNSFVCSADAQRILLSNSGGLEFWNIRTKKRIQIYTTKKPVMVPLALSEDECYALSGSFDATLQLWDLKTGNCLRELEGHSNFIADVAWGKDKLHVLSCSWDKTVRLWDLETGRCLRVLEGHTDNVTNVVWNDNQRYALSSSSDGTIRLWDVEEGRCLQVHRRHNYSIVGIAWAADGHCALSGNMNGGIMVWDLSEFITEPGREKEITRSVLSSKSDQIQYTNAKVLLVGDTSSGKTGLAHRLATGKWKPSDGSTVGAWATQWQLSDKIEKDLEREIWLWDFGGQADQRLIHQLFMDRAALILLLFDADKEDVLSGLREWQTALQRCISAQTPQFLVAGRTDTGFRASRAKLQEFAKENHFIYYETSAKEGTGCEDLSLAIKTGIPWEQMEKRTSPRIFKLIKDQILKLRDEGQVLHTFKELREELWRRLPEEQRFGDDILKTVISLLDGPGVVKELDYGTYILLQPEWINLYAQAVIRTIRQDSSELGCLPLRSIEEGKLLFQTVGRDGGIEEMKRLPEKEERIVLREMERQLEDRRLCLRQGDKLVFPSHCGRDRPAVKEYPSVFISYNVRGYLDDIYATLIVKLADSKSFKLNQLWRDASDFATLNGEHHMGIKLTREAADIGEISVYFASGVTIEEQVIFANYIHGHLADHCEQVQRLRHYVCPHCHTPKGNPEVLMKKLIARKTEASVQCDICDKQFSLWDDLERLFADENVRKQVEGLQAVEAVRLDSRRKGKLLALEVGSRITSADQKCFEIPATEDEGIDMELEFTDDNGKGTGQRLYLQLKSGNSHLEKRKNGDEVFKIKEQRWVDYWLKQPFPVMLVVGTLPENDELSAGKDKLEFEAVRWMEISSVLQRESRKGTQPVKQIVFKGERLDMTSIRKWRDKILANAFNEMEAVDSR